MRFDPSQRVRTLPPDIRPMTDAEVERLEQALGKPMDRQLVRQRLSLTIRQLVHLSLQPKAPDHRPELQRLARNGRVWLREIAENPMQPVFRGNTNFEQLKVEVTEFCDRVDLGIRRRSCCRQEDGPPRRRLLLQFFIGELIGIAKRAGVYPSSPACEILPKRPPPFYQFVRTTLSIAKDMVQSSSLTERQKAAAQAIFVVDAETALIKQIEIVRSRISDYVPSEAGQGLVERSIASGKSDPDSR